MQTNVNDTLCLPEILLHTASCPFMLEEYETATRRFPSDHASAQLHVDSGWITMDKQNSTLASSGRMSLMIVLETACHAFLVAI
jgi:hypothetical protein